ncbi:MAG TPA: asparaginase [Macromonas sp.]|nr:asparaginase [Macromonas sp.]
MNKANTLVLLGTGGTIAGRASDPRASLAYRSAELEAGQLAEGLLLPEGARLEVEQVAQLDSKDMGPEVWRALLRRVQHHLQRSEVAGIVITHGTDTLEETAYLLQAVLDPAKPVVLASAMRPANALSPDGPQNLQDALLLAADPDAQGVLAVCAGLVHGALEVQKLHPTRIDAFGSVQPGPLGEVLGGQVRWWRPCADAADGLAPEKLQRLLSGEAWPRVEWVSSHAGATGALVRALLLPVPPGEQPVRGLLVAGTGNGTLHGDLAAALAQAHRSGIRIWRTTRCALGHVHPSGNADEFPAVALPPAKARLALMLDLL